MGSVQVIKVIRAHESGKQGENRSGALRNVWFLIPAPLVLAGLEVLLLGRKSSHQSIREHPPTPEAVAAVHSLCASWGQKPAAKEGSNYSLQIIDAVIMRRRKTHRTPWWPTGAFLHAPLSSHDDEWKRAPAIGWEGHLDQASDPSQGLAEVLTRSEGSPEQVVKEVASRAKLWPLDQKHSGAWFVPLTFLF